MILTTGLRASAGNDTNLETVFSGERRMLSTQLFTAGGVLISRRRQIRF